LRSVMSSGSPRQRVVGPRARSPHKQERAASAVRQARAAAGGGVAADAERSQTVAFDLLDAPGADSSSADPAAATRCRPYSAERLSPTTARPASHAAAAVCAGAAPPMPRGPTSATPWSA
jgi:hypothetical protein